MTTNLQHEKMADYQYYTAEGTHYAIGKRTAMKGKRLIDMKPLSDPQKNYAKQCRALVNDYFPEIIDEFRGYQEALGAAEEEMLPHYSLGAEGGCSAIAVVTPAGMLIGRNYDFYYFENRRHLIKTRPTTGYAHTGMHEGLVGGRFDGMNEKGLFVCFNGAGEHPSVTRPGISFHLIVRFLLEKCCTAREARDTLLTLPVKEPKSYMLADPDEAFVVEADVDHCAVREMSEGMLIMTNHFVHPEMHANNRFQNSEDRFARLRDGGTSVREKPEKGMDLIKELMADHAAPLCGHHDGLATFWSCVGNLSEGTIQYCFGAPCRNEYKRYQV